MHKTHISLFIALAAVCVTAKAQDTILTGQISFANLVWSDGSTSSGYFDYTYDSDTSSLQSILAADITTAAGTVIPSFELSYSAPGKTDNAVVGFDYNNSGQQKYEASFYDSATRNEQIYLDWTGVGNSATLVANTPGNVASVSVNGGNAYYTPSQIGTSSGSIVPTPEPSTLALAGVGIAGLLASRRRR